MNYKPFYHSDIEGNNLINNDVKHTKTNDFGKNYNTHIESTYGKNQKNHQKICQPLKNEEDDEDDGAKNTNNSKKTKRKLEINVWEQHSNEIHSEKNKKFPDKNINESSETSTNKCGWLKHSEVVCQPSRWADEDIEENLYNAKIFMEKIKMSYWKLRRLMMSSSGWKVVKCDGACGISKNCNDTFEEHLNKDKPRNKSPKYKGSNFNIEQFDEAKLNLNAHNSHTKSSICSEDFENGRVLIRNCSFVYFYYHGIHRHSVFKNKTLRFLLYKTIHIVFFISISIKIIVVITILVLLFKNTSESLTKSKVYNLNNGKLGTNDNNDNKDQFEDCHNVCVSNQKDKNASNQSDEEVSVKSDYVDSFKSNLHKREMAGGNSLIKNRLGFMNNVIITSFMCLVTELVLEMVLYVLKYHFRIDQVDLKHFFGESQLNSSFRKSNDFTFEEIETIKIDSFYLNFTLPYFTVLLLFVHFSVYNNFF